MNDSRNIVSYLIEFDETFDNVTHTQSEIQMMIKQLITYHKDNPVEYFYQELKDASKSNKAAFSNDSLMYLLERRRLVIYKGSIHLSVKSGVISLTTTTGRRALGIEFSMGEDETGFLLNKISILNALCQYQNLTNGNVVYSVIPHTYSENIIRFNDCLIDMKHLKELPKDSSTIASLRLYVNFKTEYDHEPVDQLKEFILFVADFDINMYHRLLKILVYAYTHNVLEKMFVFLGKGRNGKGLFLQLIQTLCLGKVHTLSSMYKMRKSSTSSKESEILEILTAKATLVEEELEFTKSLFDECYKALVTGGSETGRRLGANSTTLKNNSVFFVATNYSNFSDIAADDFSFLNRVVFTDFNNKFIDPSVKPNDHVLIRKIFNGSGEILNFVNLLRLLFSERDNLGNLLDIPTLKSNYIKGALFENKESNKAKVYETIRNNLILLDNRNRIELNKLIIQLQWSKDEIKNTFSNEEGVSFPSRSRIDYMELSESIINRKVKLMATENDFPFSYIIDKEDLKEFATEEIRVTELMYLCGIDNVSKIDMTEYLTFLPEFKVTYYEEQPFVVYVGTAEVKPNQNDMDYTMALLDQLCDMSPNNDYKVSVFEQYRYPIGNVDFRTKFTEDIEDLYAKSDRKSKEETIKLLPYDITTRGEKEKPAKLLALDFDSPENGSDMNFIIQTFTNLGLECLIQESFNSMKYGYLKFHVIIYCTDYVYASRYEEIANYVNSYLPFNKDDKYHYRTIMNLGKTKWIRINGNYLDTSSFVDTVQEQQTYTLADGREIIQDRSEYNTIMEYLIDSGHASAALFIDAVYNGGYGSGNRDDTVFKLSNYLNDSLINYNMKPSVYDEGYELLENMVFNHPDQEGKYALMTKLQKGRIQTT